MLNSVTFYILNSLYSFVIFISYLIGGKTLKNFLERSFGGLIDYVDERKKNLVSPYHIAIAFIDKDSISYVQLYDLIAHSSLYGVKRITVYDPWSIIKADKLQFIKGLKKYLKESRSPAVPIFNYENLPDGTSSKHAIHLSILDSTDGREALAKACKNLVHLSREITTEDIDAQLIDQFIHEPDLLLKVGATESLAGYPPWSLRVSEIITLHRLSYNSNVTLSQFEEILYNFSKRDRRLGR